VGKVRFLPKEEIFQYRIGRKKYLVISYQVGDYPDLVILWDDKKKSVVYYDYEHELLGDFNVSFIIFHSIYRLFF